MEIRSLGYRTDLFFPRFDGIIIDRGSYLVIRTPGNPHFYWGQFLLFDAPPGPHDYQRWRELFAQEIGAPPDVDHIAFGWDAPDGATGQIQPFLEAGFQLMRNEVLAAGAASPPPHPNSAVAIRMLAQDAEWEQAIQLQLADEAGAPSPGLEAFTRLTFARYRAMAEAGRGAWFGAFLGASLIGHLGIFVEDGVGRFQEVVTHPAYRRRGICATLVYQASLVGFEQLGASELVIVAEAGSQASRIYQSVGYRLVEQQAGLAWWEGIDRW